MPEKGSPVPRFVVDLSVQPQHRYDHIVPHFQAKIDECNLPEIFEDLVDGLGNRYLSDCLLFLSRWTLRRVHSAEETQELVGISKASGISMHILVAFNVLLDLLLGCTSGGARVADPKNASWTSRMIHFRTLDWGMDELRNIVVHLDFVPYQGGPVIASSLTYLGYVGVLTGVRRGLSVSLNFRPRHSQATRRETVAFRWHQAMVVLGLRPSISSHLRKVLLPDSLRKRPSAQQNEQQDEVTILPDMTEPDDMERILSELSTSASTAAYLIFCTPNKVYIVEKDNHKATVRDSDTFLTAYNHDASDEANPSRLQEAAAELQSSGNATGMADLVAYSLERKCHLDKLWTKKLAAFQKRYGKSYQAVSLADVRQFLRDPEIRNEETHYAVAMDPSVGQILWSRVYDIDD